MQPAPCNMQPTPCNQQVTAEMIKRKPPDNSKGGDRRSYEIVVDAPGAPARKAYRGICKARRGVDKARRGVVAAACSAPRPAQTQRDFAAMHSDSPSTGETRRRLREALGSIGNCELSTQVRAL